MNKTLIASLTLVSSIISSVYADDCTDPNDPNCICTNNCSGGTNGSGGSFITGGLYVGPLNDYVALTNSLVAREYTIEKSLDLVNWNTVSPRFEGVGTNNIKILPITNSVDNTFYRAHDVTDLTNANHFYEVATFASSGSVSCGSYVGEAIFYGQTSPNFGYYMDTNNMSVMTAVAYGRSDVIVYALGKYSDSYCGIGSLALTNPTASPSYRFIFLYPSNTPTNAVLMLEGAKPQ